MSYAIWDVETTIRTSFKRKANPFDRNNYVVMSGYRIKGHAIMGEYFGRTPPTGDWFRKLLKNIKVLVGANIKFDLLYALRDPENLDAWMEFVAEGGLVWDIQLAEYLLEGMDPAYHMISLDELAPKYGGNTKFDEVKALWEAGVSTEDINPDLLRTYLCGGTDHEGVFQEGDIGNTEKVFLGQLARARAAGQLNSIYLNMGSLLCTIEMERNGMAVDVATGMKQAEELAQKIAELSVELAGYLPKDLPFDFKWNSTVQKSAIIFGGKVKYQARVFLTDAQGKQLYAQMDQRQVCMEDGTTRYVAEGDFLPEGAIRFKSGKNQGEPKTKVVKVDDLSKPKSRMEDFWYEFPRLVEPKKQWAGAKEGIWSTSADVIAELGNKGVPFLDALSKVTALTKDLTTYYITTDPDTGEQKGMLTLVQADGIIHHMLNHTATVTARFSSSNPNLQNLPKEGKSLAKAMFISRFRGGKIIQSDFTALEVYVQAILTRCYQLIEDLKAGLDMHCVRVSQKEGMDYEEVLLLCKGDKAKGIRPVPEWDKKRTKAKVFSFQRAYGAGATTISEQTGMAKDEVEALIKAEDERYPEVEEFYTGEGGLTEALKQNRIPTNKFCQHPDVPGLTCNLGKSSYRTPDGKLYTWRENPAPEWMAKQGKPQSFSPTEIKNYPVQGTGGEWAKAAMWLAVRAFYACKNFDGQALLVNQVHDALYADAAGAVALEAAALVHACMEEASVFMEWYFKWTIPVPVPTETAWGENMMDEQPMPEGFSNIVQLKRAAVRSKYINNYKPSFEQQSLAA